MCSKAFSNPECYGYHPIWIGNTDEPDSVRRIQRDIDSVGWLAAGFKVIRLKSSPGSTGGPHPARRPVFHSKSRKDDSENVPEMWERMDALDQTRLRRWCAINQDCTAQLAMATESRATGSSRTTPGTPSTNA